MAPVTN